MPAIEKKIVEQSSQKLCNVQNVYKMNQLTNSNSSDASSLPSIFWVRWEWGRRPQWRRVRFPVYGLASSTKWVSLPSESLRPAPPSAIRCSLSGQQVGVVAFAAQTSSAVPPSTPAPRGDDALPPQHSCSWFVCRRGKMRRSFPLSRSLGRCSCTVERLEYTSNLGENETVTKSKNKSYIYLRTCCNLTVYSNSENELNRRCVDWQIRRGKYFGFITDNRVRILQRTRFDHETRANCFGNHNGIIQLPENTWRNQPQRKITLEDLCPCSCSRWPQELRGLLTLGISDPGLKDIWITLDEAKGTKNEYSYCVVESLHLWTKITSYKKGYAYEG